MNNHGLQELAYDYILDQIFSRKLCPGDSFSELNIAKHLGISRTPVRGAIQKLENEGLIETTPNHLPCVSTYSKKDLYELGVIRITLEQLAIKLALLFGNYADFLQLKQLAEQCIDAYYSNDLFDHYKLDSDFHLALTEIGKNDILIDLHKSLYLRVLFIQIFYSSDVYDSADQGHMQMALVDALIAHDKQTALSIAHKHLSEFYGLDDFIPDSSSLF